MDPRHKIPGQIYDILLREMDGDEDQFYSALNDDGEPTIYKISTPFYFCLHDIVYGRVGRYEPEYIVTAFPSHTKMGAKKDSILQINSLAHIFRQWVKDSKKYSEPHSVFSEDPILKHYVKEQAPFFEIIDEDAQYAPFSNQQQRLLHQTYEQIIKVVLEHEPGKKGQEFVEELRNDQDSIGSDTKAGAVSKLSKNIAKLRKMGYAIFEKVMVKLIADGVGKVLPKVGGLVQDLLM